jgi:hypothetical protein
MKRGKFWGAIAIQRLPFTLLLATSILLIGILTGTTSHHLAPALLERWGLAPQDIWQYRWYPLITRIFFVKEPIMLWVSLAFVGVSVGIYEWKVGTRKAFWVYCLLDVGGWLLTAVVLVLPLYLTGTDLGFKLVVKDDVGMSGGGFGTLGAWISLLPGPKRWWMLGGVLFCLLIHAIFFTLIFTDVLHLVTFVSGFWLSRMLSRHFPENKD